MHTGHEKGNSTTPFLEAIIKPEPENAEYNDDLSHIQVPHRRNRDCCDGSESVTNVILGLPLDQIDVITSQLYLCCHKAVQESQKILSHPSITHSGIATSHVSVGSACHFVMELHKPVDNHVSTHDKFQLRREFVWFAVKRCDESSMNALIRDQMRNLLKHAWFQKGVGYNSYNYVDMLQIHQDQICVNLIAADVEELDFLCAGKRSQRHGFVSSICNALTVSRCIKLCPSSGHGENNQLISLLSQALHSIYTSESNGIKEVLPVVSTSEVVPSLQSFIQVDSEGFEDLKPTIHEGYYMGEGGSGSHLTSTFNACHEHKMVSGAVEEEENFPRTHKPRIYRGRRLLLQCPSCDMKFRSQKNRFKSLVSHIKRRHGDSQKQLLKIVMKKYEVSV